MKSISKKDLSNPAILALLMVPTMLLFPSSQVKGGKTIEKNSTVPRGCSIKRTK